MNLSLKKNFIFILLILIFVAPLSALERLLELPSRELFLSQGYPDDLLTMRGDRDTEDMILVQYNMGMAFLLHKNYVWQIRLDKRYRGTVLGLYMGMNYTEVAAALQNSAAHDTSAPEMIAQTTDSTTGQILIIRAFFYEKKLTDVYLQFKK
ncbi:MAG: hypothetical protein ACRCVN_07220 [Spirochaetia bacterium]